ncbi:Cof-type HAD-IIB family hydrolase [Staphylococcus auricularis]|uniref:Cof-type HAD-IIB family hydrolase n=1 Tax=Staphylococcus auricularis TaxID=29379 RepID=UPI002DBCD20B|nr:Cof-type HAD-IIB family hydrolase [Staphylococcus auricularis]MEB6569826.1 Cof-type HAD-IIB family hydrolase [Staphylococcus auricularis]
MKPYLICLDLDGTLLNDEKTISPYTKAVLQRLRPEGHQLMIATGRPFRACKQYYQALNMTTPVVNFNGAYVHHPQDPSFETMHETLDTGIATSIIESLKDFGVSNIIAEIKDHVYIDNYDQRLFDGFSMGNPKIEVGNLLTNITQAPTSILVEAEESIMVEIKRMLTQFYAENIEHRRWGSPFPVIEIVNKGINKARGIEYVKDYLNIDRSQIIAFGDENNDIDMIKYARHGIVMDNGLASLKEMGDHVTYNNNEDGIGRYLNDFFDLNMSYEEPKYS